MATLSPTGLQTATYGTTGWNNIYSTNFQTINNFFNRFNLSLNQITFSSTITVDWSVSDSQIVTLTGNTTINFSNGRAGGKCILLIKQDSTGGRVINWGSNVVNGFQPSTTGNSLTAMIFVYDSVDSKYVGVSSSAVVNNTITVNVGIISASTTLTQTNSGSVIELNNPSANATVTLPAVSAGFYVTFMGNNSSSYSYTLQPPSGVNIFWNGVWNSSVVLSGPLKGGMYYLFCDGYNYVLSYYPNFVGAPTNNPIFTGNVGIGTTSPSSALDVVGDIIAEFGSGTTRIVGINGLASGKTAAFRFGDQYNQVQNSYGGNMTIYGWHSVQLVGSSNNLSTDKVLRVTEYTTDRLVVNKGGNVGIGNTNPTEVLDVTGNIQASGAIKCNLVASLTGTTAGNIQYSQYLQGQFKALGMQANGYENNTSTNQTITFPVAFTNTPAIVTNTTGLTLSVSTTALTITAPNSTTVYNGIIEIKGF
jgi:hypothetical protein